MDIEQGQRVVSAQKVEQPSASTDDFSSPDDPDNPLNWPLWKRRYHVLVPAAAAIVCTIASSIYTPAIEAVAAEFHTSTEVAILPFSLYILGLGFGPLIAAPCSERFGRSVVYKTSLPIFALFTLGSGFSQSIAALCVTRFFAGIFGGPSLVMGSATIADVYLPKDRAIPMTLYISTPFCGPAVAPLIGGYATQDKDWRWTMWATLMIAAAVLVITMPMQETYKAKILRKRAHAQGRSNSGQERSTLQAIKIFVNTTLSRPIHMASTEPLVALTALYIAINIAILYSFFAAFPDVLVAAYGFNLGQIGLTFLAIAVGSLLSAIIIITTSRCVFTKEAKRTGKVTPERRLYLAMIASLMLPISLFWFAWTARSDIHWICPVIAEVFFACGNMLTFMSFVLYLTDAYGAKYAASAMTANTFLRYLLAAAFPLFVTYMYAALGTGWATSLLGFIELLLTPVPWAFYIWGPKLRARIAYR